MADAPHPNLPTGTEGENPRMRFLGNALAVLGFVLLFVILVWGLFHLVNLGGSSLGSLFSSPPSVSVSAPKTAVSGEPITVSWKYSGTASGTYSFLYRCEQNFDFAAGAGGAPTKIPCGAAIAVGSSTQASLVPQLSGAGSATVPLTVVFTPESGGNKTEASATIIVTPGQTASASPSQQTTKPYKPAAKAATSSYTYRTTPYYRTARATNLVAHAASGPADLSVRIIAVGVIDLSSGALLPRMPLSPSEVVGIEFDIANVGGSATGIWYFTGLLPVGPAPYLYTSPPQVSLAPGAHIVNTLRFSPNALGGTIVVTADPQGQVSDANRANNVDEATI